MTNTLPQQYAYQRPMDAGADLTLPPVRVLPGDVVTSFDGERWTFERISDPALGHRSGRVQCSRECSDAYDNGHGGRECVHMWHRDGVERSWYYPSVFDLYLGDAAGDEV